MTHDAVVLHGFHRSTASWRVRIALNLKGIDYSQRSYDLRAGAQRDPAYLALNPQGLVPALEIDGTILTQSLAICAYLDERVPEPPLLPADPVERARVRAAAQVIACDIHPVQNLKILRRVAALGGDEAGWARTTIEEGLAAFAALLPAGDMRFCFGNAPGLADILLIPQLGNADRFGAEWRYGRLAAIRDACRTLDAFARAAPDAQPDAA